MQEYFSEATRVDFPLCGLMELKVTISTTCHLMGGRVLIFIKKTLDTECGKLANSPLTIQVLIPVIMNVNFYSKRNLVDVTKVRTLR